MYMAANYCHNKNEIEINIFIVKLLYLLYKQNESLIGFDYNYKAVLFLSILRALVFTNRMHVHCFIANRTIVIFRSIR